MFATQHVTTGQSCYVVWVYPSPRLPDATQCVRRVAARASSSRIYAAAELLRARVQTARRCPATASISCNMCMGGERRGSCCSSRRVLVWHLSESPGRLYSWRRIWRLRCRRAVRALPRGLYERPTGRLGRRYVGRDGPRSSATRHGIARARPVRNRGTPPFWNTPGALLIATS